MALPTVQLASQSPRRRMLLEACALDVRVLKQEGDETWPQLQSPVEVMEELDKDEFMDLKLVFIPGGEEKVS